VLALPDLSHSSGQASTPRSLPNSWQIWIDIPPRRPRACGGSALCDDNIDSVLYKRHGSGQVENYVVQCAFDWPIKRQDAVLLEKAMVAVS
jgi:hypothetical protein